MAAISSKAGAVGAWSVGTNWVGDTAPGAADTATIVDTSHITVAASQSATDVVVATGGKLTLNAALTLSGTIDTAAGSSLFINFAQNWDGVGVTPAGYVEQSARIDFDSQGLVQAATSLWVITPTGNFQGGLSYGFDISGIVRNFGTLQITSATNGVQEGGVIENYATLTTPQIVGASSDWLGTGSIQNMRREAEWKATSVTIHQKNAYGYCGPLKIGDL